MKSKNNQGKVKLSGLPCTRRPYLILILASLILGVVLVFLITTVVHDTNRVKKASTTVSSVKADMKTLGVSEQSSQQSCSTYTPQGFGETTRTCISQLNAYFDDSNQQQIEKVLSSEVQLLQQRGLNIVPEPTMVYVYGFRYSDSESCTLSADFKNPDAIRGDRLDYLPNNNRTGHIEMICINYNISPISQLFGM